MCGALASEATTWNARVTEDAAAYCASPICAATTSQVPTARMVTTPRVETLHAVFVVPLPRVYDMSRPDDALAPICTDDVPNETFDGCGKVMFWFSEPTLIVCEAVAAAVKFVVSAESASIMQEPVAKKDTTPALIEQIDDEDPRIVNVGVSPEEVPVTVLIDEAVGVYVLPGSGEAGTAEVNDTTWPARVIVIVCSEDVANT